MSNSTLRLRREIGILYYFPFNLSFSTAHVAPAQQGPLFQRIAAELNHHDADHEWAAAAYPPLPGTLVEGGAYLRGASKAARSASHELIEKELRAAGGELLGAVCEEIVYVAHGVGSVVLSFRVKLDSVEALAALSQSSLRTINALRENPQALALRRDFSRFQQMMERAFQAADSLYDMWGILLRDQPRRGFITCMNQAFFLHTVGPDEAPALEVARDALPALLAPLTGLSVEENRNILPQSAGVEFCAEGWDGQVVVVSEPSRESWARFFFMFATCYWSVLSDLDVFLYQQTRQLSRTEAVRPDDAQRIMRAVRRLQNTVALLAHESVPANIWDAKEQLAIHQGTFDSWGTEALFQGIERKLQFLSDLYENLNNLLRDVEQERMTWIMSGFTFLTFAGVVADCISTIDYEGRSLSSPLRVFIIFLGTLGIIAVSATFGYFLHRRRSLAP